MLDILIAVIAIGILVVVAIHDRRWPDSRSDRIWRIEWILGLVAMLALLSCISSVSMKYPRRNANRSATLCSIRYIKDSLQEYHMINGKYPSSETGLNVLVTNMNGRVPLDAWGRHFRYRLVDGKPVVVSAGRDGDFDTKDDVK